MGRDKRKRKSGNKDNSPPEQKENKIRVNKQ